MKTIKTIEDLKDIQVENLSITSVSEIRKEKPRVDGRPSREYFSLNLEEGLMGATAPKNVFQQYDVNGNPIWKTNIAAYQPGVQVEGAILEFIVNPYFIPNPNGKDTQDGVKGNVVNRYKAFATKSEIQAGTDTLMRLLNGTGHTLAGTTPVVNRPAVEATENTPVGEETKVF